MSIPCSSRGRKETPKKAIHMRTLLVCLLSCLFLAPFPGKAQEENKDKGDAVDTTRMTLGEVQVLIIDEDDEKEELDTLEEELEELRNFTHWNGFQLTVNGYLSPAYSPDLAKRHEGFEVDHGRSFGYSFNFGEKWFPLFGRSFGVVTGLGLGVNNYSLEERFVMRANSDTTIARKDSVQYERNKLKALYLKLPFLLEVNTSSLQKRNFHLSVGVVGTWRVHSKFKSKLETDQGRTVKTKVNDDFNLNPFQLNGLVRIGYRDIAITGEYGFFPLFEKDKAPELNAFSVGFSWEF